MYDIIIIGGGAAGFYAAIQTATENPNLKIVIFERGKTVLGKVKVSGGGRCNVTHAEFDPKELVRNYPRGKKELLGPFHAHSTGDVMAFFEERGVPLKIEDDGRIFPKSDSSQSIIDCFLKETERLGITILKNSSVKSFLPLKENDGWQITTMNKHYKCRALLIASGSNPKIWQQLDDLGHTIVPAVPSLFTFNIKDERIANIPGLSTNVEVKIPAKKQYNPKIVVQLRSQVNEQPILESDGPLLITHWGMSGPAILKLSAWGANILNEYNYNFKIIVNWIPEYSTEMLEQVLFEIKEVEGKKTIARTNAFDIPKRLWINLVAAAKIDKGLKWSDATKDILKDLAQQLTQSSFKVEGKSTFKEEFVTAGGISLKEIDFKSFKSKKLPNLFFAGEVINVDAITGGFNFQNAWTGAYIAAKAMARI